MAGVHCIERPRYALFFPSSTEKMEMYIVQWLEIDLAVDLQLACRQCGREAKFGHRAQRRKCQETEHTKKPRCTKSRRQLRKKRQRVYTWAHIVKELV